MRLHLNDLKEHIAENVVDVHDLVDFLELTIEDILNRFPKKLREHAHKFGVEDEPEEEEERRRMDGEQIHAVRSQRPESSFP
jgi:hypothetical protein